MTATKIVLNSDGIREMLRSPTVKADLERRAHRVATAAARTLEEPSGMVVVDAGDDTRARYVVITATGEAKRAEAKARVLTRAIDAAR